MNMLDIFNSMVSYGPNVRPGCNDILESCHKWALSKDIIESNIGEFIQFLNKYPDDFIIFKEFITYKLHIAKVNTQHINI